MPPRWMSGIIVAFWLATTGWLFWHDLLPRWLAGEPPLFHPDFVDEVHKTGTPLLTNWIVERQDAKQAKPYPVFTASTSVKFDKDEDSYSLKASLDATKDLKLRPVTLLKLLKVNGIDSTYRINRSGQLLSLDAEVKVRLDLALSHFFRGRAELFPRDPSSDQITLRIWGEVRDQQFFAHCSAVAPSLDKSMQLDLPPVAVSHKGSVLMPLHPLNHIRGLRLGQSWRQPLVDPLHDAFAGLTGLSAGVYWLNASVLPQPQMLELNDSKTSCLVIEYTNDDNEMMGRTWIEQDGERVLQQEAILEGIRWIMKRESRRSRVRLLDSRHD
jgi:hypothetical protein